MVKQWLWHCNPQDTSMAWGVSGTSLDGTPKWTPKMEKSEFSYKLPFFFLLSQASWKTPNLVPSTFSFACSSTRAYLASAPLSGLKLRNSSPIVTISPFLGFLSFSFYLFLFLFESSSCLLKSDGPPSSHVRLSPYTVCLPWMIKPILMASSSSYFYSADSKIFPNRSCSTGHLYLGVTKTQIPCPCSSCVCPAQYMALLPGQFSKLEFWASLLTSLPHYPSLNIQSPNPTGLTSNEKHQNLSTCIPLTVNFSV